MIHHSFGVFDIVHLPLYTGNRKRREHQTKMKRHETDLLHGPLWNKIPLFALPVAATAILEQLFNASDVAVVGNFAGSNSTVAVAAVGANSPITGLILNLFIGIALGANVVIATVISNAVSSLLLLYRLIHTDMAIRVSARALQFDRASFRKIVQIGLPAGIQSAVFAFANIIVQAAINSLGTVVIAASSAAFNIEVIAYYTFNSFSQACTTFVGQNYGARQLDRCRRTFVLCLLEDVLVTVTVMGVVLCFGHSLLALFNRDPEVIALGYTRLSIIFFGYLFSLLYELMSGYLRGFGISLAPAVLTTLGVCGIRIFWVQAVFPRHADFQTLMLVYPLSLFVTAVLILAALIVCRPTTRMKKQEKKEISA